MGGSLLPPSVLQTDCDVFCCRNVAALLAGWGWGSCLAPRLFRKRMAYPLPYVFKVQGNFEFQTITSPKFSIYFR